MKISVITICLNCLIDLQRTIKSVRSQTHPDIEHIIIDGASTDGTTEWLVHQEMDKFISEPDDGLYDALNKGVRLATGQLIGILHAGDVYSDENVLAEVFSIAEDTCADVIYSDIEFFYPETPSRIVRRFSSRRFDPSKLERLEMPAHTATFFSRNVFDLCGEYDCRYQIASDYEFVIRAFTRFPWNYYYCNDVWIKMPLGGVSTRGIASTVTINKEIRQICLKYGIKFRFLELIFKYVFRFFQISPINLFVRKFIG